MKKYILSLLLFIAAYIVAMYLTQEYTTLKPAGSAPARLSDFFAELKPEKYTKDLNRLTPIATKRMTPQQEEELRIKQEQERLAQEQARAKAEQIRLAQERRDQIFKEKGLINIETLPVKLFLDIRYATENNFSGKKLYSSDKCYLQKDTADALVKAAQYAAQEERPFYLCLYDCYRPLSAQQALWDIHPVPGQVANPKTGSNHNRGTAVDLGPCDYQGYPLQTPTPFDDFSENAYAYAKEGIPQEAIRNRSALQKVMRKAGFTTIRKEWWHFNYKNAKNYPIVDLNF